MTEPVPARPVWLRHLPNGISLARLMSAPVLVWLAWHHAERPFAAWLVTALVSDILDGWIARRFNLGSELGALLDSVADTLLFFVSAYGLVVFHPQVVATYGWAFGLVITLWALENLAALLRYRRLSSFHTYLSKLAAYAMGFFIGSLFLFGLSKALLALAVVLAVLAALEEFALLALLPNWRSDVRGLRWVLRERRRPSA
jgi:CDP-diacylglycerol--glycerol-3-phosphate 3-phosphatidyltransferase